MARPRQSITRRRSPSRSTTATPSTTISPMFSNKTSEISETPDTSDIDEDTKDTEEKPVARRSTRSSVTATRKRLAEASSDHEESASANSKRRGTGKGMYIEIPTTTRLETPLKNKLSV
ncbi:hypothetical protein BD410DRAFT_3867 [Rickenella mellea]|uniref:Uncharacterized protein n=1 Tax=Rickenella mellea TaxID=50990 RepID=A0A4R5XDI1_9AGAM|nr:hypothetical protein BD410DRAFT_3867 [Rickenella mellea]